MSYVQVGDSFDIVSYKYDGHMHRMWQGNVLIYHDDSRIVCGNAYVIVTEADGSTWRTKEGAICFFDRHEWFNVIAMFRDDGIHYYTNISTPARWEQGRLTYIDLELDVRLLPDGRLEILDEDEFREMREVFGYPLKVVTRARESLSRVIQLIQNGRYPFDQETAQAYYQQFQLLTGQNLES